MSQAVATGIVTIYNNSTQRISLHAQPPGGDFYMHQQQVHIDPGQPVSIPKDHLIWDQVVNLQARGLLRVVYDQEALIEQAAAESQLQAERLAEFGA